MKRYEVKAIVNGNSVKIHRHFASRIAAIDYMTKFYENNYGIDTERQVAKHSIEYVYNHTNRFFVNRIHA